MVNQWKGSSGFHQHSKVIKLVTGAREVSLWIQSQPTVRTTLPSPPCTHIAVQEG